MNFRKAIEEDLPFIIDIYNNTIPGRNVTADTEPVTINDKRSWFRKHNENYPLWIVNEGKDIGWVSIQPFYGRPAYKATVEISLYLSEQSRGKGFGIRALPMAIDKCRELGIHTILGFIFQHNLPSIALFKKCGFDEWGLLPGVAEMDGKYYSLSILGLKLNNYGALPEF